MLICAMCVFQFNVDSIAVCMFGLSSERAEIQLKCTPQFPIHGVGFVYFKVASKHRHTHKHFDDVQVVNSIESHILTEINIERKRDRMIEC